jgi:hypothetical protein
MKISEVIKKLQEIMAEYGDLEVYGVGHPGEQGYLVEENNFTVGEDAFFFEF